MKKIFQEPNWPFVSFWNLKAPCFTWSHWLSFVLPLAVICCHLLHLLWLDVIRYYALWFFVPLVVTRCTPRLSFYKRSTPTAHLFYNLMVEVHLEFLIGVRWKCKLWIEEFRYFGEIKNSFTVYIWWRDNRVYFCYLRSI